jgi:pimeloyl-ACP methyl ester carboxylesterase
LPPPTRWRTTGRLSARAFLADVAFRDNEQRRWEHIFADHHTVIVDGAGHFVQSGAAGRFAAVIRARMFAADGCSSSR